jgi:hypothetical protein
LQEAQVLDAALADRLVRAASFRNWWLTPTRTLDMMRVHDPATHGPTDLQAFLTRLAAVTKVSPKTLMPFAPVHTSGAQAASPSAPAVASRALRRR